MWPHGTFLRISCDSFGSSTNSVYSNGCSLLMTLVLTPRNPVTGRFLPGEFSLVRNWLPPRPVADSAPASDTCSPGVVWGKWCVLILCLTRTFFGPTCLVNSFTHEKSTIWLICQLKLAFPHLFWTEAVIVSWIGSKSFPKAAIFREQLIICFVAIELVLY